MSISEIQNNHLMLHRTHRGPCKGAARFGLSIMEVLFAIAVLTIGLLGVASILPVATNNSAMALQSDRAVEEINNRVAADLARIKGSFNEVIVANNSGQLHGSAALSFRFGRPAQRFFSVSTAGFRSHLNQYDTVTWTLPAAPAPPIAPTPISPSLPDAFCIDPWFLTEASCLRDDAAPVFDNRNGYDRTLFPCYDPRYHPLLASPSAPLSASVPSQWDGPRFTRIALPFEGGLGSISPAGAEDLTRTGDDLSLFHPLDRTLGPGLFVQRSQSANDAGALSKSTLSSRYSSIVLMSRSETGSSIFDAAVVTMEDRHLVAVDRADFGPGGPSGTLAHNLAPYTAANPANPSGGPVAEDALLFDGEQLGYVSYAERPMTGGGGGEFIFRTNGFVEPDIDDGDWIMLMRREYERETGGNTGSPTAIPDPQIVPGALHFSWYQVSNVSVGPERISLPGGDVYQTQISVRGPDWVFHPIQVTLPPPLANVYAAPYYGNESQPTWGTPPRFDLNLMPPRGSSPAATSAGARPFTPVYEHQDYGTFIVLMPDVISVKQFQVEL